MINRVRKSRAWDVKNKEMIMPEMPFIGSGSGALNVAMCLDGKIVTQSTYDLPLGPIPEFELIWMDWLGIPDKGGNDLYEGDVVKTPNGDWGVLVWNAPFFELTVSATQSSLYTREWLSECERIGNIYQTEQFVHLQKT